MDFLLAGVVDGVLVAGEVVSLRKDGVARFPSRGVNALSFVRARSMLRSHLTRLGVRRSIPSHLRIAEFAETYGRF